MIGQDDILRNVATDDCYRVDPLDKTEHEAIRALFRGEATPHQQRAALAVIANKFCRTHVLHFHPDSPSRGAFMAGRAFVGQQILSILNIPVGKMRYTPEETEK